MMLRKRWVHVLLVLALALAILLIARQRSAGADTIDPHKLYEQKCAGCHEPHAADFAKVGLKAAGDKIVGKQSGRELGVLLANHRGTKLSPAEVKALTDHFGAMLPTGWLYQEKCLGCHDRAVVLARTHLIERDGQLVGRYSGRDIDSFLSDHGRLTEMQADVIRAMLRRQLATRGE